MAMGEPVPGAEVYIELEPDDQPIANTTTDSEGDFSVFVPEGIKLPENGFFNIRIVPPKILRALGIDEKVIRYPFDTKNGRKFQYTLSFVFNINIKDPGNFTLGNNSHIKTA